MLVLRRFLSYFSISSVDPEVMESQINAFTKQAPLLYLILNANVLALAYTHYAVAPKSLTVVVPLVLFAICVGRVVVWMRTLGQTVSTETARKRLRSTYVLSGVLASVFTLWSLCLFPYGGAYAKSHVAFFISITVIGCIFCLMHLRPAALLVTAIVTVPFTIRFMTTGEPVLTAIAINFILVAIVMVYILFNYYRDFTDLVHSQKHLVALSDANFKMANLDSLTELPNRRSFFRDLGILIKTRERGTAFALGLIDLDGFKPVNDVHGHGAGDRVLVEVGLRLRAALDPDTLVARLGGDEFAFVLPFRGDAAAILEGGRAICKAIQEPIRLQNGTAQVAASIGFALSIGSHATQEQLIERADYALYYAKAKQRGTPVIFSAQHENAIRLKSLIEQDLRRADFETEMTVKFQPIVSNGTTVAYEALARWDSPLIGSVPPMDFIAAAERTGLINRLTVALFAKALSAARTWPETIDLSFNLSVHDIATADLIARLRHMIEVSGLPATRIVFEITETALMHDFEQARDMLLGLMALGAKIALDDFGTGFSSLHYIHRLPLDKIKIDRSFIGEIATDTASRDIVKSIIDLCRNLKITCVVEGVETAEQVVILRAIGCNTMQGYYFGRPADASALVHLTDEVANPSVAAFDPGITAAVA